MKFIIIALTLYIVLDTQNTSSRAGVLIGASLSEPHTSGKNGMSITFTIIYVEIRISGMSIMHSQKFTFKNWVITYNASGYVFITQMIIRVVY